jgi:hypothetical protein
MGKTNIIDRIDSGAVFEVPLLGGNGYSYIKLQKFYGMENGLPFLRAVFRVFSYFSKTRYTGDIKAFEKMEYTYVPILLLGIPRVRGPFGWKYLGDITVKSDDEIIPNFSFTVKDSALMGTSRKSMEHIWSIVKNLSMIGGNSVPATLEDVMGIGAYDHVASIIFSVRLTIFWNRRLNLGLNIEELVKAEGLYDIIYLDYYLVMMEIEDPLPNGLDNYLKLRALKKNE